MVCWTCAKQPERTDQAKLWTGFLNTAEEQQVCHRRPSRRHYITVYIQCERDREAGEDFGHWKKLVTQCPTSNHELGSWTQQKSKRCITENLVEDIRRRWITLRCERDRNSRRLWPLAKISPSVPQGYEEVSKVTCENKMRTTRLFKAFIIPCSLIILVLLCVQRRRTQSDSTVLSQLERPQVWQCQSTFLYVTCY